MVFSSLKIVQKEESATTYRSADPRDFPNRSQSKQANETETQSTHHKSQPFYLLVHIRNPASNEIQNQINKSAHWTHIDLLRIQWRNDTWLSSISPPTLLRVCGSQFPPLTSRRRKVARQHTLPLNLSRASVPRPPVLNGLLCSCRIGWMRRNA